MRVHSGTWFLAATLAVVVGLNSPLPGAEPKDDSADGGAAADSGAKKASPPVGAKDPVALAFALPSGVVLNAKQKTAYEDLKQNNEADLRQAFDDLRQAKTGAETSKALKAIKECKAKIREGIQEILTPSNSADSKSGSGAAGSGAYVPQYGYYGGYYPYGGGYYYPYAYRWPPSSTWHGPKGGYPSGSSKSTSKPKPPPRSSSKK